MRFHFGVSKFIKPSKLLYWFGLAFIGLLAWLGLTQQEVYAETTFTNFNLCPYMLSNNSVSYSQYRGQSNITHNNQSTYQSNFAYYCNRNPNNNDYYGINNYYSGVVYAVGINANSNIQVNEVTTANINTNFCGNVEDTNSLDLFMYFQGKSISEVNTRLSNSNFNNRFSQITSLGDILAIYLVPRFDNEDTGPLPEYACSIVSDDVDDTLMEITCLGVPYDSHVVSYDLKIYNELYASFDNKNDVFYVNSSMSQYDFTVLSYPINLNNKVDYTCSYVEPVEPNTPLFEEDGLGNSNVTINDCPNDNGICIDIPYDTIPNYIKLEYPNTFTQFLEFPLYLASAVVNNHNVCHPIQIDFSSLTRRFGGSNYVLTIPCLSTRLQQVFGYEVLTNISLYDLIDMFIAFYLLYKLAMRCIMLINMAMSGQDLTGYLFSGSEGVSSSDPIVHNGEVAWKNKKFTRRY